MAICKLCLNDKPLIKKSHIIPEFMYRDLFDKHHKMAAFNPYELAKGVGIIKRPSSGEYEGGLLCVDCDNKRIGNYEDYASKAIYGGTLPEKVSPKCDNLINQHGVHFTKCRNISYQKFKIFLLSILWRASISTRELFAEISLGPHEDIIRKMIYDDNPGCVNDYPIFIMTYVNDKNMPKDLVAHPQKRRTKNGHTMYVFIIGGMLYMYYVNSKSHKYPRYILTETINPSNELNIYHVPVGKGWDLIRGYYGLTRRS